jgi:hypothetical protein
LHRAREVEAAKQAIMTERQISRANAQKQKFKVMGLFEQMKQTSKWSALATCLGADDIASGHQVRRGVYVCFMPIPTYLFILHPSHFTLHPHDSLHYTLQAIMNKQPISGQKVGKPARSLKASQSSAAVGKRDKKKQVGKSASSGDFFITQQEA